jgi:hypothetical protein
MILKGTCPHFIKANRTWDKSIGRKYDKEIGRVLQHIVGPGL